MDSRYGKNVFIFDMTVIPTQKIDEQTGKWVPDSYAVFLTIRLPEDSELRESIYHFGAGGVVNTSSKITDFLESMLGLDVCVDFF